MDGRGRSLEFLKIIGPLTDPTAHGGRAEDAFHVVISSLPGFGFSDKPKGTGWNLPRIAAAWGVLMRRLGYDRWVAQGGDWGARTTTVLGQLKPPGLIGIHLNFQYVFPETVPEKLSPEEQRAVDSVNASLSEGFRQLHATRLQTIGYALADSPAGQALWIYEKFRAWTDNNGAPEDALSMDQMLDDISIYWFTNTAASSARIYWENRGASFAGGKVTLPVAASVFPRNFFAHPEPGQNRPIRTLSIGTNSIAVDTLLRLKSLTFFFRNCGPPSLH